MGPNQTSAPKVAFEEHDIVPAEAERKGVS
jgi:hypothetical protein